MDAPLAEITASIQRMADAFLARLPYLVVALLAFLLFYVLARAIRLAARRFAARASRHANAGLVIGRLAYGGVVLLGALIALVIAIPGFTPGQLISVLGISSVAIGFAFRDILQNFLAGILILINEPFRIGDQIVVNGLEGTVEEVQTRATLIRTYDGRRVVIPNSTLFVNSVVVNTAYAVRRIEYDVGVGYGDDLEQVKRVIRETLCGTPGVLSTPAPDVLVWEFGPNSVNVRVRWWIEPPKQFELVTARDAVLHRVKDALTAAGIDLPFPTQQVLFHDQTEEEDGNRGRQREGWPAGAGGPTRPARRRLPAALARPREASARDATRAESGVEPRASHDDGSGATQRER